MKYAISKNNVIQNVILLDDPSNYSIDGELVPIVDGVPAIGWTFVDGDWVAPEPPEDTRTYAEKRQSAYPPLEEQMDMQYWDSVNGTTVWADTIAAVKAKYPKPE